MTRRVKCDVWSERAQCWRSDMRRAMRGKGTRCLLRLFNCTGRATTVDHIIPISRGGDSSPDNLRPACRSCNERKGNRLDSELTKYDFALTDPRAKEASA